MAKLPGLTIAEALGFGPRGRKFQRQREAAAAAAAPPTPPAPTTPQRPTLPDLAMLTAEDRQRVTQAMGIDMPAPIGWNGPPPDATLSRQLAGRYLQDLARFREHEHATHNASIAAMAGKIDGTRANRDRKSVV